MGERETELAILLAAKKAAMGPNCQAIYADPEPTPNVIKATIIMFNTGTNKMERSFMFGCWHENAKKWRELVNV